MEHRLDIAKLHEPGVLSSRSNSIRSEREENEKTFSSHNHSNQPVELADGSFRGHARLLSPQLRPDLIQRSHLFPRTDCPFVLIVGPAGAGKTTLVSQWLASIDRPSTWLTMDATDNNLSSFVRHVVAAIQQIEPDVGHSALGALRMPEPPPAEMIGNMLVDNLHAVTRRIVVVLDDFQEIESDNVRRFMSPLLRYPTRHVQIAIISRSYPALPLARLRAHGELEEIRWDQLRFSEPESRLLLQSQIGHGVSDESLTHLLEHNEGWAVGLRFAGLAMRGAKDPDRVAETIHLKGERHSLDFLFEEVFGQLSPEVQEFLLRTSCVNTFSASLSAALTWEPGETVDSERLLQWLIDRDLFLIPLSEDGSWYRYHHVFRLLLSRELRSRHGMEMVHRLLSRARDWFDERGSADQAVWYSLAADEPIVAADIVKRRAQSILVEGNWPVLESWLSALPHDILDRDPELLVLSSWCAWLRGRSSDAERFATQSRTRLVDIEQPENNVDGIRAELDCIDVTLRWIIDEPAAQLQTLERAIPKLPAGHHFARGQAIFRLGNARMASGNQSAALHGLYAFANSPDSSDYIAQLAQSGLVSIYAFKGDIVKASTAADRLLRMQSDCATSPSLAGSAHWLAGVVAYERSDLARASRLLEAVISNRESIPFVVFQDSLLLLATIHQIAGRATEVDVILDDLLSLAESINYVAALESARAYAALFAFQRGRLSFAFRWLDRAPLEAPATPPMFSLPVQLILARLLIERGTPEDLKKANRVTSLMEKLYLGTVMPEKRFLQLRVLRSLLEERLGSQLMADELMREALDVVRPDGFVRTLIDFGPSIAPVLRRQPPGELRDHLLDVLNAETMQAVTASQSDQAVDTVTSETVLPPSDDAHPQDMLTTRELEVLELLRARLTNREIAAALFISPLTVKRHNSNIFDKLGVNSRRQAVLRGEEIGLLPLDQLSEAEEFP